MDVQTVQFGRTRPLSVAVVALMTMVGCGSVRQLTRTLDHAVDTLETQSENWQDTLRQTEADLAALAMKLEKEAAQDGDELTEQVAGEARGLIDQVNHVLQENVDHIAATANCQRDILRNRVAIDIRNLKTSVLRRLRPWRYSSRTKEPYIPWICTATPSSININNIVDDTIVLNGIDLNVLATDKPILRVVQEDGSEKIVTPSWAVSRISNYQMDIAAKNLIGAGWIDPQSRQIVIKWNDQRINENEISITGGVCGGSGQLCCDGNRCDQGNNCIAQKCTACGGENQPCCKDDVQKCQFGSCQNGTCLACGEVGQPCCPGWPSCAPGAECQVGTNQCVVSRTRVDTITVTTTTGCRNRAGTNDSVWFSFAGHQFELDNDGDDREMCKVDVYAIDARPKNIYYLPGQSFTIQVQKGNDGDDGGWYLETLDVGVNGQSAHHYGIQRWFEDEDNKLSWEGTFSASGSTPGGSTVGGSTTGGSTTGGSTTGGGTTGGSTTGGSTTGSGKKCCEWDDEGKCILSVSQNAQCP
jgi:hypothetical protein